MLGLRRGTVELCEYSDEWPLYFEQEKISILQAINCEILDIQHIGSTSIPGLKAKPILDIGLEIEGADDLKQMIHPLEKLGYTYFGDREQKGDYFFRERA
jgi:GrpB-like predicted nucleotidyltransferase (UPF0157 family)